VKNKSKIQNKFKKSENNFVFPDKEE